MLAGHTDSVDALASCTVGGRVFLLSGSEDRTVRIWYAGLVEAPRAQHEGAARGGKRRQEQAGDTGGSGRKLQAVEMLTERPSAASSAGETIMGESTGEEDEEEDEEDEEEEEEDDDDDDDKEEEEELMVPAPRRLIPHRATSTFDSSHRVTTDSSACLAMGSSGGATEGLWASASTETPRPPAEAKPPQQQRHYETDSD